jgi:phage baseplate assembly protein W
MIQRYIGTGLKYPLQQDELGKAVLIKGQELIRQSISKILSTPLGSRFFNREYGSRIKELIFEPNDDILKGLLEFHIEDAIAKWEKRVEYIDTQFHFDHDKSLINCIIYYRIHSSNQQDSLVWPFYRQKAA